MKKHKLHGFIFLIILALTGCKSVPSGLPVNAIDLLDNESAFYITIPKSADPQLLETIINNAYKNLTQKDIQQLVDRINTVYCGINHKKNNMEYQLSVSGDIPVKYVAKVLNKKNGWNVNTYKPNDSDNEYKLYNHVNMSELQLCFPSNQIICAGRNITGMINKFDTINNISFDSNIDISESFSDFDDEMYDWLSNTDNSIHFYANKPQSFLSTLTGSQLDLKLFNVKGSFKIDEEYTDQYILDLYFNFKNDKFRKVGKSLLSLAFGLTDSQTKVIGETELNITGIKLNKKQLYQLFNI